MDVSGYLLRFDLMNVRIISYVENAKLLELREEDDFAD